MVYVHCTAYLLGTDCMQWQRIGCIEPRGYSCFERRNLVHTEQRAAERRQVVVEAE